MRIVQPSVARRNRFAVWARTHNLRRHSNVSWYLPEGVSVPTDLMDGAQIDGKPPKGSRTTSEAPQPIVGTVPEVEPTPVAAPEVPVGTVAELREQAADAGVEGYERMRKAELQEALTMNIEEAENGDLPEGS